MSKFKKVAKFVSLTERLNDSMKKQRFVDLKESVKQRRTSIMAGRENNGGLNSKYEQELEMEKDMQILYNARYEMSDDDLSECGSGLEDLIEDEIEDEENEDEDSQAESNEEEENDVNVVKNINHNDKTKEDEDSESITLDSDIEEMLKESTAWKTATNEQNSQGNDDDTDEDDDDEDDDDSEESVKSDLELDDIIQSEDNDDENSSEDAKKDSDEEEELNYSALEEEEYDSEAFSFTGISDPTERDSMMSNASKLSRASNLENNKRAEDEQRVDEANKKICDEAIEEESEDERAPSITYSRSISDIEEYESDLFELESDEVKAKESSMYFQSEANSDGDFSIPRPIDSSSFDLGSDVNDEKDDVDGQSGDGKDKEGEVSNQNQAMRNGSDRSPPDNAKNSLPRNESNNTYYSEEVVDQFIKDFISDIANELAKESAAKGDANEVQISQDIELQETNDNNENRPVEADVPANNGDCNITDDGLLSHDGVKEQAKMQIMTKNRIVTYQQLRKKDKKLLKKKERMEVFKRSNISNNERRKCRPSRPDPEIPSYKAKLAKERQKYETVDLVLNGILDQSMRLIDKTENREMVFSLMEEILADATVEATKRAKEKQSLGLVNGIVDDVLDMWESRVDANTVIQNEIDLNQLCGSIVRGTLVVAARDAAGATAYKALHKTPIYKADEKSGETDKRAKKLMSRRNRKALRVAKEAPKSNGGVQNNSDKKEDKVGELKKDCKGKHNMEKEPASTEKQLEMKTRMAIRNSNCGSCTGDKRENDLRDIANINDAIYVGAEDDISCGVSTRLDNRREGSLSDNCGEGDEVKPAEESQLQQMENEQNENAMQLSMLPSSDKDDYCFQWIMNYGRVPRPPTQKAVKKRSTDARKRRFVKKETILREMSESEASIRLSNNKSHIIQPIVAPSLAESGVSFIGSGGESEVSVASDVTLESRDDSVRIKTNEDSIDTGIVNDIKGYFENVMKQKIFEKDLMMREKEKEEEERRINIGEVTNGFLDNEGEAKKFQEIAKSSTDIGATDTGPKSTIESESELNELDKHEEKHTNLCDQESSGESIFPYESEGANEVERGRFPTPDSEIECETIRGHDDETNRNMKKKRWLRPLNSIIRWKNVTAVIKPGETMNEYSAKVIKMRRSRFQSLSLARPKSLIELGTPVKKKSLESNDELKRSSRKAKGKTGKNELFLPSIVIPSGSKAAERREIKRITLPDINRHENFMCY